MRKLIFILPATLSLVLMTTSVAVGNPPRATSEFTIVLENVTPERAGADLLTLFVRETNNQTRIDVTLVNKRVAAGHAKPRLYYLRDQRVRPGQTIRVKPKGRAPAFEAKIQFVEAFFPTGKPPQLFIRAFGPPPKPDLTSRPYPRLSPDNFRGRRALVENQGKRKADLITCFGDTPGDLRIRGLSLAEAKDVGLAFSTTYKMTDVQHRWDANNGLQTRYFGEEHVKGRK